MDKVFITVMGLSMKVSGLKISSQVLGKKKDPISAIVGLFMKENSTILGYLRKMGLFMKATGIKARNAVLASLEMDSATKESSLTTCFTGKDKSSTKITIYMWGSSSKG